MEGLVPGTIVLALGAGALGGADALRLLLQIAGRSPLRDIVTCVMAMAMVTAHILGTVLLARFVCKARAGGGAAGAPAMDLFAFMTATVSGGAAFLVTACLLVESGGLGALRLPIDFAAKNPIVTVTVLFIGAVAGGRGFFPYSSMPLVRFVRRASPAADRAMTKTVCSVGLLLVAVCLVHVVPFFAPGAIDTRQSLLADVSVAVATVAGTLLLARFSRRARNAVAAGVGGGAAPAPATDTRRFAKLTRATSVAVVAFALASLLVIPFADAYAPAPPGYATDSAKYASYSV